MISVLQLLGSLGDRPLSNLYVAFSLYQHTVFKPVLDGMVHRELGMHQEEAQDGECPMGREKSEHRFGLRPSLSTTIRKTAGLPALEISSPGTTHSLSHPKLKPANVS